MGFEFEKPRENLIEEHLNLLRLQLDLQDKFQEEVPRSISNLYRFFKIYVKGFRGANDLRMKFKDTKSTDEVRVQLDAFIENYHEEAALAEAALAVE